VIKTNEEKSVWVDPYEASAHGVKYKSWRWVIDHQTLDPYACEAVGIPYEEWRKLERLRR
jgi:hypothetical protein